MHYDVIALACEQLSYRDKLRLAQLLIQLARKEEENANPQSRIETTIVKKIESKTELTKEPAKISLSNTEYITARLLKLKPANRKSLTNSIKAMFQFQGGVADSDIDKIISDLQKHKVIKIEQNKVTYL